MSMKKVPLRQCIGCQEMKSKKRNDKSHKTAEDEIMLDATGRKNGRGRLPVSINGMPERRQ